MRGKLRNCGGTQRGEHRFAILAALAARQHGVVSRRQLTAAGLRAGAINRLIAAGQLHPIHRGVFAVGHPLLSREGRWMAAVLAGGEGAVLSHRSAAELWGLLKPSGGVPSVTTRAPRASRRGLRFHTSSLPADEVGTRRGIPVTCVARTLLDIAPSLSRARLKSTIDVAENRQLAGGPSLPDFLRRYPRRPGSAAVGRILGEGRVGFDATREEFELRFAEFIDRFRLPKPEVNGLVTVGGRTFEVDCVWRAARLVVELDSRKHHMDAAAFEGDRERDRLLVAAGWKAIRVTWRQLHDQPQRLAQDIRAALRGTPVSLR